MSPVLEYSRWLCSGLPRTCGDEPIRPKHFISDAASAPHLRG